MVLVLVGFSTAHVVYAICDSDRALTRSRASTRNDSTYADGEFTATGWYGGLPSSITVTVRLTNGIITAVKVVPHATDPTSLDLQRRFAAAVPAVVVGKRIDQVKVGKLAGSSGTPQGFNDAIRRITEEARRARRQQRAET
jgi:uncharacterized protein with FMN-binding domain